MAGKIVVMSQRNQALVERLLDDLGKLMWSMVWDVANHNRWQLEAEEVHAELCLELCKLVNRYGDKPYVELKRICVTSMRNRVHDLATACYLTNRKAEGLVYSLDSDQDDNPMRGDVTLEYGPPCFSKEKYEEYAVGCDDKNFDMDEFCDGMSDDARCLVHEILFPSERTAYFLWLTVQRKQVVSPKGFWTLTITPAILTRSLGWPASRLKIAWAEVGVHVNSQVDFKNGLVAKEDGK